MAQFIVAFLVLASAVGQEDAPRTTLDPVAEVSRLTDIFRNCELTAVQTLVLESPTGLRYEDTTQFKCVSCSDCAVVLSRYVPGSFGRSDRRRASIGARCVAKSWSKVGQCIEVKLRPERVPSWPSSPELVLSPTPQDIETVFLKLKTDLFFENMYKEISLFDDFAGTVKGLGITFARMVRDGGSDGFILKKVQWASEDRSSVIRYDLESPDYGMVSVTFKRVQSDWYPALIAITLSSENKVVPDGRLTAEQLRTGANRLKNYPRFPGEFSEPYRGLDRCESAYEISYRGLGDGKRLLPRSIKLTEVARLRGRRSVARTLLDFTELRPGEVSCEVVRKAMFPIPDGCLAFAQGEKTSWTTKNGEVVSGVSGRALQVGRGVGFTPRSRGSLFVWINAAMFATIVGWLVLRWRRDQAAKGGSR